MSEYQPGKCQTPRGSNFFKFVSSDSGFTSAVSTVTASSNSSRCSSRLCHHIREERPCDNPLLVAKPAVDPWYCGMWVGWKIEVQSLSWDGSEGRSPCDKPLLVAAPAVDLWSCGMWVGRMLTVVQSLSWDGTEGRKEVVPGCEEDIKPTNWSQGLPTHVGSTIIMSIQISIVFWDKGVIICHLLYCYNSPHPSRTQVFMWFVCI